MTLRVAMLVLLLAGCGAPAPELPREVTSTTTPEIISAAPTTTRKPPVPFREVDFDTRHSMEAGGLRGRIAVQPGQ